MNVDLENADRGIVEKALKKLGYEVTRTPTTFTFKKGTITGSYDGKKLNITNTNRSQKVDTDEIKREVSKQAILKIAENARKQGWELTKEGDKYVLTKEATSGTVQA